MTTLYGYNCKYYCCHRWMWDNVVKHFIEILNLESTVPFSQNYEIHDYDIWIWHNFHELKTIHEYAKWWTRLDLPKVINNRC